MKQVQREFLPSDRYQYDFITCTTAKGWAQVDTRQDASYFGQWVNPTLRQIVCYCEGDVIITTVDTDDELVREMAAIKEFTDGQGYPFLGIDPGFSEELKERLMACGLGQFFHSEERV